MIEDRDEPINEVVRENDQLRAELEKAKNQIRIRDIWQTQAEDALEKCQAQLDRAEEHIRTWDKPFYLTRSRDYFAAKQSAPKGEGE